MVTGSVLPSARTQHWRSSLKPLTAALSPLSNTPLTHNRESYVTGPCGSTAYILGHMWSQQEMHSRNGNPLFAVIQRSKDKHVHWGKF